MNFNGKCNKYILFIYKKYSEVFKLFNFRKLILIFFDCFYQQKTQHIVEKYFKIRFLPNILKKTALFF